MIIKRTAKQGTMTRADKQSLVKRLQEKIQTKKMSQSAAAKMIGLSAATISNMIKGKWDNIGDAWHKVALWVGNGNWQIAYTKNLESLFNVFSHAQQCSLSKAIAYRQGSGKTCAALTYTSKNTNTFYFECEPHYTKKVFLQKLSKALGIVPSTTSISALTDAIINHLNSLENPLVFLDEFDQLSNSVFPFFKTFYNKTMGKCGFILIGGEHFPKRIKKGVELARQSYCEIYSRFGGEFLSLHALTHDMIQTICEANGILSQTKINTISSNCKGDLRRVRNLIEQEHYKKQ